VVFQRAEDQFGRGDYDAALGGYAYIVNSFHASPYAPRGQSRIAYIYDHRLSDEKRALDAYTMLHHLYPESPEAVDARLETARIYSGRGEHRKAVEDLEVFLKRRPSERERVRYLIAMEYVKMNDFRQARIEFNELLRFASDRDLLPKIRLQIANTHYIEGSVAEALNGYDTVIRDYPDHEAAVEAMLGRAGALDESGRPAEALAVLRGLVGRYPNKEAIRQRIASIEARLAEAGAPR
jgi:tetratricopeptide (TPR) repeat protein